MVNCEDSYLKGGIGYSGAKYRVGIWGIGHDSNSVGWQTCLSLTYNCKEWLGEIVCANRSKRAGDELLVQEANGLAGDNLQVSLTNSKDMERLHQTDVLLVCIDDNQLRERLRQGTPPDRFLLLNRNLPEVYWLGKSMHEYNGNVIVVSNPVDDLSQIICHSSGLPTGKVMGFSMQDTVRMYTQLQERARFFGLETLKITDCYTGGPHDASVALFLSLARINGQPALNLLKDVEEDIKNDVRKHGALMLERNGNYSPSLPFVLTQQLMYILGITELQGQTGSVYHSGVYHGFPIDVLGGPGNRLVVPRQDFFVGLEKGNGLVVNRKKEIQEYTESVDNQRVKLSDLRYTLDESQVTKPEHLVSREETKRMLLYEHGTSAVQIVEGLDSLGERVGRLEFLLGKTSQEPSLISILEKAEANRNRDWGTIDSEFAERINAECINADDPVSREKARKVRAAERNLLEQLLPTMHISDKNKYMTLVYAWGF